MNKQKDKEKTDWPAIIFIAALPFVFYYGGFWIGIIALFAGAVILGWKKRYAPIGKTK